MGRVMKEWVLVPASQSNRWLELVEQRSEVPVGRRDREQVSG